MTSRRVAVSKSTYVPRENNRIEFSYEGTFVQWGMELFEQSDGPSVTYSVAIVEKDDGQVDCVYPPYIRFLDKGERNAD